MKANRRQMRMVVNLEILEARNVNVKSDGRRDSLFVRYYLSTGNGNGNGDSNILVVNTREVTATPHPQWNQNFSLECGVSLEDGNLISELQKESVRFELRERSRRIRILGNMFRASKMVGWVEIAWKNLLASNTLSINSWIPLSGIKKNCKVQPSLHLAISLNPLNLVKSASLPSLENRQEYQTSEMEIDDRDDMSVKNEKLKNTSVNLHKRTLSL